MIQNNRTVTSEGGYRSKSKYNQYVLDNVSNEIDNILKSTAMSTLAPRLL